ncbi:hypothetical protein [Roseibium sp.]|uniref:hypothetical protein n=1 Tax=Roseibium sp. TaxID=1936156 RepID=UPI003A96E5C6
MSSRPVILEIANGLSKYDYEFDPQTARRIFGLLGREAVRGSSTSVVARAVMMEKGLGVEKDLDQAHSWYVWGMRVGNRKAFEKVFNARLLGQGRQVDIAGAREALLPLNPKRQYRTIRNELRELLQPGDPVSIKAAETYALRAMEAMPEHSVLIALEMMKQSGFSEQAKSDALSRIGSELGKQNQSLVWNDEVLREIWDVREPEIMAGLIQQLTVLIESGSTQAAELLVTALSDSGQYTQQMAPYQDKIRYALRLAAYRGHVAAAVALARDLMRLGQNETAQSEARKYWAIAASEGAPEALLQDSLYRLKGAPQADEMRIIKDNLKRSAQGGYRLAEAVLMGLQ